MALANGQAALALQRFTTAAGLGAGSDAFYARLRLAIVSRAALAPMLEQLELKIREHDEDPERHLHLAMLLAAGGLGRRRDGRAGGGGGAGLQRPPLADTDPVLAPLRRSARCAGLLAKLDERLRAEHNKLQLLLKAHAAAIR